MIPVGYMAKRISKKPEWLHASEVLDIYSVSSCNSENFADYISFWKHNGYWLFDSPEVIQSVAHEHSIELAGTALFYYEAYEMEFDGTEWKTYDPDKSFKTDVAPPIKKELEGFDLVTFMGRNAPECSPLSCNSLAEAVRTNNHCLFVSFEEAKAVLNDGIPKKSEPGPYRIFSVYSVDWPPRDA